MIRIADKVFVTLVGCRLTCHRGEERSELLSAGIHQKSDQMRSTLGAIKVHSNKSPRVTHRRTKAVFRDGVIAVEDTTTKMTGRWKRYGMRLRVGWRKLMQRVTQWPLTVVAASKVIETHMRSALHYAG